MKDKINEIREIFNNHGKAYAKSENVRIENESIENVNCGWFIKVNTQESNQLIIYFHGGAFALGGLVSHTPVVSHFADAFSIPILFIDYSLAPEAPFPTAIIEVVEVYQHILQKYGGSEIIFMGDSAGAGLAISVISKLNENRIAIPKSLVMISPWTDLTCGYESHTSNTALDPIFGGKIGLLQEMASLYAGNRTLKEVSPIELMNGEFPQTLILVGSTEVLLDDSKAAYKKMKNLLCDAKLSIYENQKHVWPFEDINTDESKKALTEIQEFLKGKLRTTDISIL